MDVVAVDASVHCFCSLRSRAGQPIIEQVDAKIGTLAEIDTLGKSKS